MRLSLTCCHRRSLASLFLIVGFVSASPPLVASPPMDSDWSRIVPGDVRFYVEFRGLSAVRVQFSRLGIWDTVMEMREHDVQRRADDRPWQQRTRELLGMDPDTTIGDLLGYRSALIAANPTQWDNGVLLAELARDEQLERMLEMWNARESAPEGPVKRYSLSGGLMLAALGRLIAIAPAGDPDGLWGRTVLLMAGQRGPTLGGKADYAALRTRLSPDPQGLLYAVWKRNDPTAVAGCRRLVVGVWVEPDEILCEMHGQRARPTRVESPLSPAGISILPRETLGAWFGSLDLKALQSADAENRPLDEQSVLDVFLAAIGWRAAGQESLIDALGPECRVLFARDSAATKTNLITPAVAMMIEAKKGPEIVRNLDVILDIISQGAALFAAEPGRRTPPTPVIKRDCEGVDLHSIKIGPVLARRLKMPFLRHTEISWGALDNLLIVSSSREFAEKIIRAARSDSGRIDHAVALGAVGRPGRDDGPLAEFVFLRGAELSRMLASWVEYVETRHPALLEPGWWQRWADRKVEDRTRLDIALSENPAEPGRAVVEEVGEFSPAFNILMPGDVIIAAAGQPLAGSQPARQVADRYRNRGASEVFQVTILRDGEELAFEIKVPPATRADLGYIDPVSAVRQLAALARQAELVTYRRHLTRPERLDAAIRIRWNQSSE